MNVPELAKLTTSDLFISTFWLSDTKLNPNAGFKSKPDNWRVSLFMKCLPRSSREKCYVV